MIHRTIFLILFAATARADDTTFSVSGAAPKHHTAEIEFRDSSGAKWPNFFHGKPAGIEGFIDFDATKPGANFTLLCDKMAQDKGDQSRKVLGALPQPLTATLAITRLGPLTPAAKAINGEATHTGEMTGTLEVAGKRIAVRAETGLWVHDGKGDEKSRALMLTGSFNVKPADVGLPGTAPIAIRFGLTAFPGTGANTGKQEPSKP